MGKKNIKGKLARLKQYSKEDIIYLAVVYGVLLLVIFICLYPIYFTVIASVSDPYATYRGEVFLLPKQFTLEAYKHVIQNSRIWRGYANTILYTVFGTLFNLFLTIPAAYALSKKWMYGRGVLMTLFVITMYFGGGMVPNYILMKNLGLIDNPLVMIIGGGLSVYNLIVSRVYFENSIPESLYEAATIDGASEMRCFIQIALPLCKAIVAVMTLYYAVGHWNSYFEAMIYLSNQDYHPLQLVLRDILISSEMVFDKLMETGEEVSEEILLDAARKSLLATTMKYSLVFISSAPMLAMYPFVQKHFVKGVMIGSVKG